MLDADLAADDPGSVVERLSGLLHRDRIGRLVVDGCDGWPDEAAGDLLRTLAAAVADTSAAALATGAVPPRTTTGLCDVVLQLHSLDDGRLGATRPLRTLTVPKMRGRGPSHAVELVLSEHGLQVVSEPLEPRPRTTELL
jgi:hypothetical protein